MLDSAGRLTAEDVYELFAVALSLLEQFLNDCRKTMPK